MPIFPLFLQLRGTCNCSNAYLQKWDPKVKNGGNLSWTEVTTWGERARKNLRFSHFLDENRRKRACFSGCFYPLPYGAKMVVIWLYIAMYQDIEPWKRVESGPLWRKLWFESRVRRGVWIRAWNRYGWGGKKQVFSAFLKHFFGSTKLFVMQKGRFCSAEKPKIRWLFRGKSVITSCFW